MATFTKLKSGSWRVQVRRKNEYVANTFIRRRDAEAIDVERSKQDCRSKKSRL